MTTRVELKKSVPVVADVDVLVAGGGMAGCMAAVAAARAGSRTLLVDRFGALGGGMGPGMIQGAPNLELPAAMANGMPGLPGEFIRRCESYLHGPLLAHYLRDSQVISYVWLQMMKEAGVQLLLNTWATDPIMDGTRVAGLFVENKSGTQAIQAKVVIDATGDADVATRAGAPVDQGETYGHPGMWFAMGNVDFEEYNSRVRKVEPDAADVEWARDLFRRELGSDRLPQGRLRMLIPYFRPEWEAGTYKLIQRIGDLGIITLDHGMYEGISGPQFVADPTQPERHRLIGGMAGVQGLKSYMSGDAWIMSALEVGARTYIFETAQFLIRCVPGFQNAYLHIMSPYFHSRGGRSIISEYPLTREDADQHRHQPDVIFQADDPEQRTRAQGEASRARQQPFDFPYRQFLPRNVDGLLVTGRAAIIQPPVTRVRWMVFLMGQAAGVAAALAARSGVSPRNIKVRDLQRILHETYGVDLGDAERLQELGLS